MSAFTGVRSLNLSGGFIYLQSSSNVRKYNATTGALVGNLTDRPGDMDWLGLAAHWVGGFGLGLALQRQLLRQPGRAPWRSSQRRQTQENPLLYRNQFESGWRWQLGRAVAYAASVLAPWLSIDFTKDGHGHLEESSLVFCLMGHLCFWLLRAVQSSSHVLCREREQGGHVPIVGVVAVASDDDSDLCLAAGMDDVIVKPISPERLEEKILQWTNGGSQASASAR